MIYLFIASIMASCSVPVAMFDYSAEQTKVPASVQFHNQSQKADSFIWDFGDGNTSTEMAPIHIYKAPGSYTVKLKAAKGKNETISEKKILIDPADPIDCLIEISTDYGTMTVRLSNATPLHRDNFIKLAEEGYFDSLLFHRVINGFMVQGGDPNSKGAAAGQPLGMGGPGYTIPAEFVDSLAHTKGAIAAARTGGPSNPEKRSSGSQFYLVQGKPLSEMELNSMEARKGIRYTPEQRKAYMTQGGTPFLDGDYTVFGYIEKGMDVLDKIAAVQTDSRDRPRKDVAMKVRVIK